MANITYGVVGLGRMGGGIAVRAHNAGLQVVAFDYNAQACELLKKQAPTIACVNTLEALAQQASIIWLMVPAGDIVDRVIQQLIPHMQPNSIIIDGGNSNFHDSIRRAQMLQEHNVWLLDCGTSGGLHGKQFGFSLMIGGKQAAYDRAIDLFAAIAAPGGYGLVGPSGAGHYVKMVHNGIEYALLQAYAQGFHILKEGSFKQDDLDLAQIADIWQHGSIIRSWILELAHAVLERDQQFESVAGSIEESGTGRWTVEEAQAHNIPAELIATSLDIRAWSRDKGGNYATKLVALLRHEFGGHAFKMQHKNKESR